MVLLICFATFSSAVITVLCINKQYHKWQNCFLFYSFFINWSVRTHQRLITQQRTCVPPKREVPDNPTILKKKRWVEIKECLLVGKSRYLLLPLTVREKQCFFLPQKFHYWCRYKSIEVLDASGCYHMAWSPASLDSIQRFIILLFVS